MQLFNIYFLFFFSIVILANAINNKLEIIIYLNSYIYIYITWGNGRHYSFCYLRIVYSKGVEISWRSKLKFCYSLRLLYTYP